MRAMLVVFISAWLSMTAAAGSVDASATETRTTSSAVSSTLSETTFTLDRAAVAAVFLVDNVSLGDNTFIEVYPGTHDESTSTTYFGDVVTTLTGTDAAMVRIESELFGAPRVSGRAAVGLKGDADAGVCRVRVCTER